MTDAARPSSGGELPQAAPAGLSAFAAKVLDQLSVSAWLPAGLFAASLSMFAQFRSQGSTNLRDALDAIGRNWLPVLLLALPILILGTLLTQAFSFGAIRALEGYGLRRWPFRLIRGLAIWVQVLLQERLQRRKKRRSAAAFDAAEGRWAGLPAEVVLALRAQAHELRPISISDAGAKATFDKIDWRSACDPWDLARFDDASEKLKEYPQRSRILPTRLGNVLRATEDAVVAETGEDLVTFAIRRRSLLEPRAQHQHDQFRTRLDMYCTLVFVSIATALVAAGLGVGTDLMAAFNTIAAGYVVLAFVAYRAAIGSARGYCTLLRLMASLSAARQSSGEPSRT